MLKHALNLSLKNLSDTILAKTIAFDVHDLFLWSENDLTENLHVFVGL